MRLRQFSENKCLEKSSQGKRWATQFLYPKSLLYIEIHFTNWACAFQFISHMAHSELYEGSLHIIYCIKLSQHLDEV